MILRHSRYGIYRRARRTRRERRFNHREHREHTEDEGRMSLIVLSPSLSVLSVFSVVKSSLSPRWADLGGPGNGGDTGCGWRWLVAVGLEPGRAVGLHTRDDW